MPASDLPTGSGYQVPGVHPLRTYVFTPLARFFIQDKPGSLIPVPTVHGAIVGALMVGCAAYGSYRLVKDKL